MKKTLWAVLSVAVLAVGARAAGLQPGELNVSQDVTGARVATNAVTLGTTFSQADTPKLDWSYFVEVQNLSTEQICCRLDTQTVSGTSAACQRIDTASTAARPSATDWKRWKRWAQNLSLYCRSLKGSGGTADIIVTQGR